MRHKFNNINIKKMEMFESVSLHKANDELVLNLEHLK